jgi:predicted ATPase
VLEAQFPETPDVQPELLAHHYTEAGLSQQAIAYWQQAGQNAMARSAHAEAIVYLRRGLALIAMLPDPPERLQRELSLQMALGVALMSIRGYAAPEVEQVYVRAHELCRQVGDVPHLFTTLRGLWMFYLVRAELPTALKLGEHLLQLARHHNDATLLLEAHRALGSNLFFLGDCVASATHLEQGLTLYDVQQHRILNIHQVQDTEAVYLSYIALTSWIRGYPNQALQTMHRALALGQELAHPYSLGFALTFSAILYQWCQEIQAVQEQVEASIALAQGHLFPLLGSMGTTFQGWVIVQQGDFTEGIGLMQQGLDAYQTTGAKLGWTYMLALLAESYSHAGQIEEGLTTLADALAFVDTRQECWWEAELHRLKGELLLQQTIPDVVQAETSLQQALVVARQQHAKSLELRVTMSLSRLWQQQGKRRHAWSTLSDICHWFTEGNDTADLRDAKTLLELLE